MKTTWDTLSKEMAAYGFRLHQNGQVEFSAQGQKSVVPLATVYEMISSEIKENIVLFKNLWNAFISESQPVSQQNTLHDPRRARLFVSALKDLRKLLDVFSDNGLEQVRKKVDEALGQDIIRFSKQQVDRIIDVKFSIDWVNRIIMRLIYIRRLIKFAAKGRMFVTQFKVAQTGLDHSNGPWGRLDNIVHMWKWTDEEDNLKGRERDIQQQQRYTKGYENYNSGEVGEGHYWRELKNEPYSWYDKSEESSYPRKDSLFWN
jgi:hypothetical protein